MKRIALIGHRGVGKTSLLKRIEFYFAGTGRKIHFLDLDREIRERAGTDLQKIFETQGEEAFRKLERQTFSTIDSETRDRDVYLALGAGFDPALIPETWTVLWVRRSTDEAGRIFIDRPRLNSKVTALEEFQERYHRRESAYRARADQVLWLDEGSDLNNDPAERSFFLGELKNLKGAMTILPAQFRSREKLETWAMERAGWGIQWFELRDDLLTEEQMSLAANLFPDDRILVSFRNQERVTQTTELVQRQALAFDWPLEMGECEFAEPTILSLHERRGEESIAQCLERFPSQTSSQMKAALPVRNFEELKTGDLWRKQDPSARCFLPHSTDGRWHWYRMSLARSQPLNFIREGDGSGADQPTLLRWARLSEKTEEFAAVLGDPVKHSRTPMEQREFFRPRPVVSIRATEQEVQSGALEVLAELGLRWAAVTSPLKELAFEACVQLDEASRALRSVNTLQRFGAIWSGANTDLDGLREALSELPRGRVAVWGGGGTLNVIRSVLPQAQFFSLRTRENRDSSGPRADEYSPDLVIWAVGRSKADINDPPEKWRPELVFDLNYSEDSPGRAFALNSGSRYISGLSMFQAQARAQRKFWKL